MPSRIPSIFLPLFFCITTLAQDVTLQVEAARFAKEAEFLRLQRRHEAALEQAETAAALDPENTHVRQVLIASFVGHARHLLQPTGGTVTMNGNPPGVDLETAQLAFRLADRALELSESLGEQEGFQVLNDNTLNTLRLDLHRVAYSYYSALQPESDQFRRRLLDYWFKYRLRPGFAQIHDTKSCEEAINSRLREANNLYFTMQTTDVQAEAFEETIEAMLRLTKQWDVDVTQLSVMHDHCLIFAQVASMHRNNAAYRDTLSPPNDDKAKATFARTIARLESDPRPFFRFFGWIAKNKPVYYSVSERSLHLYMGYGYTEQEGPRIQRQSREYFAKLLKLLGDLPSETSLSVRELYYSELKRYVLVCGAKGSVPGLDFSHDQLQYYSQILETANQRHEFIPDIVNAMIQYYGMTHSRTSNLAAHNFSGYQEELTRLQESTPRFKQLIARQIELAEKENKLMAEQLYAEAIQYELAVTSTPLPKPWVETIEYDQVRNRNNSDIHNILLRGETLYLFRIFNEQRLDQFDTRTGDLKSSKNIATKVNPDKRETSFPNQNTVFVDDRNAYFGEKNTGILIFPLDGSDPWRLTMEDGLPGNSVQALGSIGGKLYAGLGERDGSMSTTWLVTIHLDTKKIDTIASSSGREGKAPFYNLSPPPRFAFFLEDTKRNRLLLFVDDSCKTEAGGLWAIDGTTGDFSQIKRFQCRCNIRYGQLFADGDRLLAYGGQTYLIDLNDTDRNTPAEPFLRRTPNCRDCDCEGYFMVSGAVFEGYLWGIFGDKLNHIFWGRIPLDFEVVDGTLPLQRLQSLYQEPFGKPMFFVPMSDGKRFFASNNSDLILLRFE